LEVIKGNVNFGNSKPPPRRLIPEHSYNWLHPRHPVIPVVVKIVWLGSVVIMALDLRSRWLDNDTWTPHCRGATRASRSHAHAQRLQSYHRIYWRCRNL